MRLEDLFAAERLAASFACERLRCVVVFIMSAQLRVIDGLVVALLALVPFVP